MTLGNRLDPPFRADHVGSLLRPAELIEREQEKLRLIVEVAGEAWGHG